jgi:homoserine kinase
MPATARLVAELRAAGVAAVVSGAGPSVLALTTESMSPPAVTAPRGWRVLDLRVDERGAEVVGTPA